MLEDEDIDSYRQLIDEAIASLGEKFQEARDLVKTLDFQTLHPERGGTTLSLASDGGHARLEMNPFNLFVVRVVDSEGREVMSDVVSPWADMVSLSERQFKPDGTASTPLGFMMLDLLEDHNEDGEYLPRTLTRLSPMIPDKPETNGWVTVYRDLCEWAALYEKVLTGVPERNLIYVRDGLLRTKIFADGLLKKMHEKLMEAVERHARERKVLVGVAGVAKHSEVVNYYKLALLVEDVVPVDRASWAVLEDEVLKEAIRWEEYIWPPDKADSSGESAKFNIGKMYFVRFGKSQVDPIWAVDVLYGQRDRAAEIIGALAYDAEGSFPIPCYPMCLQDADAKAQIAGFSKDILRDQMFGAIRSGLNQNEQATFDLFPFDSDPTGRRYF